MFLSGLLILAFAAARVLGRHGAQGHRLWRHSEGDYTWGNEDGLKSVGYFPNWGIYAAEYFITDVPAGILTHLPYAFANVDNVTGKVVLSDTWADLQFPYPGDNNSAPGNNVYGNVKQMYLLKKKHRNLKTLLSIGGWSYRDNFPPMLASETKRQNFVNSTMEMIANLGFDGVDIDYEYVTGQEQAQQMVDLLKNLREGLDNLADEINSTSPFLISYASPAGPQHYTQLDFAGMTPYVDYYTFMALDYSGPGFSNYSGYLANLYPDTVNTRATDFDTNSGIEYYTSDGKVPPNKIVLQNPLYGRSFNVTNGMGDKFADAGTLGSLGSPGTWSYKDLPIPGFNAKVVDVPRVGGSYSYDAKRKYLVSYDTPKIARQKADYVQNLGLAGTAYWDLSMDRNDSLSLVSSTVSQFGGGARLDQSLNNLNYPTSIYDNLRAGFPDN